MSATPPRFKVEELDSATLRNLDGQTFFIANPEIDLPCRLKLLPGSESLFVMLNGAVNRASPLPVFARWNWGRILGGHVLAVCDPTLYLNDKLRLGWYVGNLSIDPMRAMLPAVEGIQRRLGIADGRVVFYGSSGGGFASLVAAAFRPVGRAIVVNPQIDITNYVPKAVERFANVFAPGWTPQRCRDTYPLRWNALAVVADARRAGRDLRILYAQNLVDKGHHERDFLPFCKEVEAPTTGGLSADATVLTHVFSSPEGHGAEPPEVVKYMVSHGLTHLFSTAGRSG